MFHWLGAVCAQNINNWKLSLFVMDNSCVDARSSLVLWMLLQLLAPLGELIPPSMDQEPVWEEMLGFVLHVSHPSVVAAGKAGTSLSCLQGRGYPYRGGSRPALL